ncbi:MULTISPECIES: head-tail adaptor protein [unclassified Mameliella]|uniref:head-tail adaptor protein n=1 Tax=unclassified Mameliella TaxID=2630630 RepID=UPI00273E0ED9|nr:MULTISPECIES: head-tail adaptor protein [unclassified Mameliella]
MGLNAGNLDRRIQIRRANLTLNDYGGYDAEWYDQGAPIYAQRRDVSDAERYSAGAWDNKLVTRFVIRNTAAGRDIRRTDRLTHEGITYEIDGIKEVPGKRAFLEITAWSEEPA